MGANTRDLVWLTAPEVVIADKGVDRIIVGRCLLDRGEGAYLNVGDGYRNDGDILLNRDELAHLIGHLTETLGAMDDE